MVFIVTFCNFQAIWGLPNLLEVGNLDSFNQLMGETYSIEKVFGNIILDLGLLVFNTTFNNISVISMW